MTAKLNRKGPDASVAAATTRFKTAIPRRLKQISPYFIATALFSGGLYALHRLLAPVHLRDVMLEVQSTPTSSLAIALLTTLGGYAALIGYDWSALRYIGKRLPFRVIALGGFLGYSIGNTIGLNALTGGAVRYRIYSALGLDAYDVAAIAAFASASFGFGATIIGLGSLAVHPDALQTLIPLHPETIRAISLAVVVTLLALTAYIAVRRITIKIGRFRIDAPSLTVITRQMVFTALDLVFAASTLYILLPASDLGFTTFVAIFIVAMNAGMLSHVPGGIGVFESIVIAALPASIPLEPAAAALLLYRLIYYLLPFAAAAMLLALLELRMVGTRAEQRLIRAAAAVEPVMQSVRSIVPVAMAVMVFGSGLWMLISALIPNISRTADELEHLVPLAFVEGGALLSSAIGAMLIVVAHGLLRRIEGAFWFAIGALIAGVTAALAHGIDYDRAIILATAAIVLWPCRREFYRSARLTKEALTPAWFALIFAVMLAGAFVILFAHKSTPYTNELWWQFAFDQNAPRAMRAGLVASLGLTLGLIFYSLRQSTVNPAPPREGDLERAALVVAGQPNPDANFVFTGDKALLFSDSGDAFIMYGVHGRSWIALGDPVGPRQSAVQLAWNFYDAALAANARPVFYEVGERYLPLWIDMGLALHKLGEEAVVDLSRFNLDGSARKKLRAAHNRALRDGLTFDIVAPQHNRALLGELGWISDTWLSEKHAREKRFSCGRFDPDYLGRFPLAVVRFGDPIVAFANVLVTNLKDEATIDLMRHLPDTPDGVMEFLFVELMLALKADGYRNFSLGMAPLSGLEARRGTKLWTRFGALLFRHGGHFYNFEGLRRFKDKFDPDWHPKYLASPPALSPLVPLADAAILIAGSVRGIISR